MRLYHRTNSESADAILEGGYTDHRRPHLTSREWSGVWFSREARDANEEAFGDVLLVVDLDLGSKKLARTSRSKKEKATGSSSVLPASSAGAGRFELSKSGDCATLGRSTSAARTDSGRRSRVCKRWANRRYAGTRIVTLPSDGSVPEIPTAPSLAYLVCGAPRAPQPVDVPSIVPDGSVTRIETPGIPEYTPGRIAGDWRQKDAPWKRTASGFDASALDGTFTSAYQ